MSTNGIFITAELTGPVGVQVRDLQRRFDPKLANELPPHITIFGSSGAGPINPRHAGERAARRARTGRRGHAAPAPHVPAARCASWDARSWCCPSIHMAPFAPCTNG